MAIEAVIEQMEDERKLDRSAAIADMRYIFINDLCKKTVIKPEVSKERKRSAKTIRDYKRKAVPLAGTIFST